MVNNSVSAQSCRLPRPDAGAIRYCALAYRDVVGYQTAMSSSRNKAASHKAAFTGEALRALSTTLLLLGLSGGRRVS